MVHACFLDLRGVLLLVGFGERSRGGGLGDARRLLPLRLPPVEMRAVCFTCMAEVLCFDRSCNMHGVVVSLPAWGSIARPARTHRCC